MATEIHTCNKRDLLSKRLVSFLIWWIPIAVLLVTAVIDISSVARALAWSVALLVMGAACFVNASLCGRVHCYFTGPFFLLLALTSLLHGIGIVSLGQYGWNGLGMALLLGAFILGFVPEMIWGRYSRKNK